MNVMPLVFVGLAIVATHIAVVSTQCTSTGSGCLLAPSNMSSCQGRPDGDYQACEGCTFYHSCSGGYLWANRPCPLTTQGGLEGRLVWRATSSNSGRCDYSSPTCKQCASSPSPGGCTTGSGTGVGCITQVTSSCRGRADGDYQACEGCNIYHTCSNELISPNRLCPATIDDSQGLRGRLVWNAISNNTGICDYTSLTCKECSTVTNGTSGVPATCSTGTGCISQAATSCNDKPDGDYQACEACTIYHTCSNKLISANRPCGRRSDNSQLVWVTESLGRGHCDYSSSTCSPC